MSILFISGTKKVAKSPPISTIIDKFVFQNLILTGESFAKALRGLKICVLVNNSLCKKLVSSLEFRSFIDLESYSFAFRVLY